MNTPIDQMASHPSVDVRTSATLALEGFRERLIRILDMVDDAAAGRVALPLEADALSETINECIMYLFEGESLLGRAREALDSHVAKVKELSALDAEIEAASRALRDRCERRTRHLVEYDAAVLEARRCLARVDASTASPVDLDTLVRSAERLGYTRAPPADFIAGTSRDIRPMLPGRPGEAELRNSRLFLLQGLAASLPTSGLAGDDLGGIPPDILQCLVPPHRLDAALPSGASAGRVLSAGRPWLDAEQWFSSRPAPGHATTAAVSAPAAAIQDSPSPPDEPMVGSSAASVLETSGGAASGAPQPAAPPTGAASTASTAAAANPVAAAPRPPAAAAFPPAVLAAMAEAGFPPDWRFGDALPAGLRAIPPALVAALRAAKRR